MFRDNSGFRMKKLFPMILALVLSGCCGSTAIDSFSVCDDHESPWPLDLDQEDCGYVDGTEMTKIVISYAAELKRKHRLELEDSRIYYDTKINKLRLDFYSQAVIELCEARQVLVDIVDGYLERINSNSILSFQMDPRPFDYKNIEVHITYGAYHILYVDPYYIAHVTLEDGIAWYLDGELDDKMSDYWMKRIESYPKTREIALIDREVRRLEEEEKRDALRLKRERSGLKEQYILSD